ncbi:DNA repair protein RadA [Candidatus Dependentiae bacterium]|nr:DNA repair protein RadA [Candidatus Dependentiae bacterium]
MSKNKNSFSCSNCEYKTLKWVGCCPDCKLWNTFEEIKISPIMKKDFQSVQMSSLENIHFEQKQRILSGIKEWDRVTGGGLMPGSFMIITGDPGIGKSTLLLKIANEICKNYKVFYFSSEESLEQIKLRAQRTDCLSSNLLFADQANLDEIIATCLAEKPNLIIIDSIQNCYTQDGDFVPGSIGQLKESAFRLMRLAKENHITVITTGHITKDGVIAGPKTLEHIVDAVFYLQGEDRWQTRILRAVKNRFGNIDELGFFQMHEEGLIEVPNINQQILEEVSCSPGSVLISYIEGSRPLLIELQALSISTKFSMPQRIITGIDPTQVILTAAILEKYLHVKLSAHDIFFKISGGFKIKSSSADLGIALALLSSYFQKPLPDKSLALGEISLTGQIKPINHFNIHVNEAFKFGIDKLLISKTQKVDQPSSKFITFNNVYELLNLFGDE